MKTSVNLGEDIFIDTTKISIIYPVSFNYLINGNIRYRLRIRVDGEDLFIGAYDCNEAGLAQANNARADLVDKAKLNDG